MTSYAPPTIDYFSGLQFNPNIYENTVVQGVSKVFGALVTIIGTISAIIMAPIIQLIGSNSVDIFTPTFRHRLSSGGAIQLFINSTLTSLQNATQLTLFSPDTRINASGTSAVLTTIGNGIAGGTLSLNQGTITLTGNNSNLNSGTTTTAGATLQVNNTTTNLNSTTTTATGSSFSINNTTCNFNATGTNIQGPCYIQPSGSFQGIGGGGSLIIYDGDATTNTGLTTFNGKDPATDPTNSVLIVQTSKIAATVCNLSGNHRDGFIWYLANQGQSACTVNYGTTNIFGPGLTRTGVNTCNIPIGGSRMFRSCLFPSNTLGGGFTNGWFTVLL